MKIQTTEPPVLARLRTQPQETARDKAEDTFSQSKDVYWKVHDEFEKANDKKESSEARNFVIGLGLGLAGMIGIAASGVLPANAIQGYGIGALALPLSFGLAGYAQWSQDKQIKQTIVPKLKDATKTYLEDRAALKSELLKEIDDEGVTKTVNHQWQVEHGGKDRKIKERYLESLSHLADSRVAGGWKGKLARSEDDPIRFRKQEVFVAENPNLESLLRDSDDQT